MPCGSFEQDFLIEYTHNSTAIGNTLTLLQTKVVLEDGISVGGKTFCARFGEAKSITEKLFCICPEMYLRAGR